METSVSHIWVCFWSCAALMQQRSWIISQLLYLSQYRDIKDAFLKMHWSSYSFLILDNKHVSIIHCSDSLDSSKSSKYFLLLVWNFMTSNENIWLQLMQIYIFIHLLSVLGDIFISDLLSRNLAKTNYERILWRVWIWSVWGLRNSLGNASTASVFLSTMLQSKPSIMEWNTSILLSLRQ